MPKLVSIGLGASDIPNFEPVLITRILETGDLRSVIKRKITEDYFFLPEPRAAFTYLVGHYQEYGCAPSIDLFLSQFPDFSFHTTSDSPVAICDQIRQQKLYRDLAKMANEGSRLIQEDPQEALEHFKQYVASLTTQHTLTRDVDITKATKESRAEYERVKSGHGLLGIQWPWAKLNEITLGIQDEELIFFYARPKSLKTWLMIASAVNVFKHGRRPLFVTCEMPVDQIRRRIICTWSGLDYEALRSGKLTPDEEKQYEEDLEAFSEMPPFVVSGNDDGGGVISLESKIQEYNPDVLYVDGVYLMHDDRAGKKADDHRSLTHITQDLKGLAKRRNLPIIGTTQANRMGERTKGSTMAEVAGSDSFAQDCDYMIRVIYDRVQKDNNEAIITLPGIREAPGCTFTINALVARDLSQKFVCDNPEDIEEMLAGTDESIIR